MGKIFSSKLDRDYKKHVKDTMKTTIQRHKQEAKETDIIAALINLRKMHFIKAAESKVSTIKLDFASASASAFVRLTKNNGLNNFRIDMVYTESRAFLDVMKSKATNDTKMEYAYYYINLMNTLVMDICEFHCKLQKWKVEEDRKNIIGYTDTFVCSSAISENKYNMPDGDVMSPTDCETAPSPTQESDNGVRPSDNGVRPTVQI